MRFSPQIRYTTGIAATAPAETRSDTIEQVRRFTRSMATPAANPTSSAGTAVAVDTAPTLRGLPVVCKTISGNATARIPFPRKLRQWELRYATATTGMPPPEAVTLRTG